MFMEKILSLDI